MVKMKFVFTAVCDHYHSERGSLRACAAVESVEGSGKEMPTMFARRSEKTLARHGWHLKAGCTLCPDHNTATNRRRTFAELDPDCPAAVARALRS